MLLLGEKQKCFALKCVCIALPNVCLTVVKGVRKGVWG